MSTNYDGNPTATQAPSLAPGPGIIPTAVIPADGEAANVASITQMVKVNTDFVAWLMTPGHYGEFREEWIIAPATLSATTTQIADLQKRWDYTLSVADATQTLAYRDPTATYGARSVLLDQGTSANNSHVQTLTTHNAVTQVFASSRISFEVDVQVITRTLTSPDFFQIGFTTAAGGVPNSGAFALNPSQPNWYADNTTGGGTTTGVAVSVGTPQRLRFMIDRTLGTPSTKFYINDSLVRTDTVSVPTAGTSLFVSVAQRPGATGVSTIAVGDLVVRWSKF